MGRGHGQQRGLLTSEGGAAKACSPRRATRDEFLKVVEEETYLPFGPRVGGGSHQFPSMERGGDEEQSSSMEHGGGSVPDGVDLEQFFFKPDSCVHGGLESVVCMFVVFDAALQAQAN